MTGFEVGSVPMVGFGLPFVIADSLKAISITEKIIHPMLSGSRVDYFLGF
ncbi:hypothetical protein [Bacillus sp. V3-13]|nr:hypothetical protein [Bacillus sp. V3-13]